MEDRTKRIPVGVNSDDLAQLKALAADAKQTLSRYVRERLGLVPVKAGRPKREVKV